PCGRCRACLRQRTKSCPVRQANWLVSCEAWPHFQGGFGQYFYLRPNHAVFKLPDEITDEMAAGVNCAYTQVYAGLDLAGLRAALDLMHRTLTRYPWEKVVSHKFPLEAINDAFVQQDQGHVTRAAIVPN